MTVVLHKSNTRGSADLGWLKSRHTFSFSNYHDAQRVHFGTLRVLNDDIVAAGMGFGTHPHDNMEIISIPLSGSLEHKDSMGTASVIENGEVQIMSAGKGVRHSEYNHSKTEPVNFLQLWIFPKVKNIEPRYEQKLFAESDRLNKIQTIVSPNAHEGVCINQDAWLSRTTLENTHTITYQLHNAENGVYLFILSGTLHIGDIQLSARDGLGITDTNSITLQADSTAEILFIEVPMNIS